MQNDLPNDIESLKAIIKQLLDKIERLEAENAELRRRLGLDSSNSHKPPSSDGYRKKNVTPGIPKEKGRRSGGQKGHQGDTLARVAIPDRVEVHLPSKCQCCGRLIGSHDSHEVVGSRQVFDLPDPKLEVTEHQIGQVNCCGVLQQGEYPSEVNASVQYGAKVRAMVVMLSVDHKMPLEQISQHFEDLYGYKINTETILEALERGYELAEPIEQAIKSELLDAPVVHFDETGARAAGRLHWLHNASTETSTYQFVHPKRGQDALRSESSLLKDFTGTAVHDCFASYFKFEGARHIPCGSHLLRELQSLMEDGSQWAGEMHSFLLFLHKMPRPMSNPDEIYKHYEIILREADREEPQPIQSGKRGRCKQTRGRNLLDRFRTHQDGVLAFALEKGIPFTNNQAERDLRGVKVKQKITGGFRTLKGAHIYARVQSVMSTFRKRSMNIFSQLRDLFSLRPVMLA